LLFVGLFLGCKHIGYQEFLVPEFEKDNTAPLLKIEMNDAVVVSHILLAIVTHCCYSCFSRRVLSPATPLAVGITVTLQAP
jgi:hypothetical protein